jgi:hypothetical protein
LKHQLHGILTLEDLKTLPRERWRLTHAREVMRPIAPRFFVEPSATLEYARQLMKSNGVGSLAVVNNKGELVGFLQNGRLKSRGRPSKVDTPQYFSSERTIQADAYRGKVSFYRGQICLQISALPQALISAIIHAEQQFFAEDFLYAGGARRALCKRANYGSEVHCSCHDRLFRDDGRGASLAR